MNNLIFDTHDFVKRLTRAGMPEEQAEVLASTQAGLIDERLATKDDLKALEAATRRDIQAMEVATRRDIKALETTTKSDIKALEVATKNDIKALKSDIKALESSTKNDIKALKSDIKALESSTKSDIKAMELRLRHDLTVRLGVMMTAMAAFILGAPGLFNFLAQQ